MDGYSIEIKDDKSISSIRKVEPVICKEERLFCEHHMLRAYTSAESLQDGIEDHKKAFKAKEIDDYVLVILKAPEGHRERERQAMEAWFLQMGIDVGEDMLSKMTDPYPGYDFIIYSATQLQTEDKYWDIIKTDPDTYGEVVEIIDDYEREDRIHTLHDYAVDVVSPTPECDTAQIGYIAKLENYLYNQNWTVQKIIRGRRFDNEFLDDMTILDELTGGQGRTRQKYIKEFDSRNRAGLVRMKKEIDYCLQDNKQWKVPVADIVDDLLNRADEERFKGKVYIYNPMHIIYTIYLMAKSGDSMSWAPYFNIIVEYEDHMTLYFGELKYLGKRVPFDKILKKYFEKNFFDLAFSLTWGGYLHNDPDMVKDLGFRYQIYKVDMGREEKEFYEYIDYDFKSCDEVEPFRDMQLFLQTETDAVEDIVHLFEDALPQKGYNFV